MQALFLLKAFGMKKKQSDGISFTGEYHKSSEGGMCFISVPEAVKRLIAPRGTARVVATIGHLDPFQCGLMPVKGGDGYLIVNKDRQKQLGLKPGETVTVLIQKDESEWGAPMPEELEALLAQDEAAKAAFEGLSAGRKRAVMYGVGRKKSVEARIEAAVKLLTDPRAGHARW